MDLATILAATGVTTATTTVGILLIYRTFKRDYQKLPPPSSSASITLDTDHAGLV